MCPQTKEEMVTTILIQFCNESEGLNLGVLDKTHFKSSSSYLISHYNTYLDNRGFLFSMNHMYENGHYEGLSRPVISRAQGYPPKGRLRTKEIKTQKHPFHIYHGIILH